MPMAWWSTIRNSAGVPDRHGVRRLLVLWDVDYTLVNAGGVGMQLYRIAFTEMFGGEPPRPPPMAGRTDRAIALEVLALAGIPDPRRHVAAFEAVMAAHAPELADLIRDRGKALPGAARALAAIAMASVDGAGADGAEADGAMTIARITLSGTPACFNFCSAAGDVSKSQGDD